MVVSTVVSTCPHVGAGADASSAETRIFQGRSPTELSDTAFDLHKSLLTRRIGHLLH